MSTMSKGHRTSGVAIDKDNRHPEDWYATPAAAVHALLRVEKFEGRIYEPCCGDGAISKVLKETNHEVTSSDIVNRGYGDFFGDYLLNYPRFPFSNIITNPPYDRKILNRLLEKAIVEAPAKTAMILRIQALEGMGRRQIFNRYPPARLWVFSERVQMMRGGVEPDSKSMVCYAWFVWDKQHKGKTELGWI